MKIPTFFARAIALSLLLLSTAALADPPGRVARLGYMQGDVSFGSAQDEDWVQASLNRPLSTGDRLWTDRAGGAELQLGGAAIRMGERSYVSVLNLDDSITQLQLSQGAVKLRIRSLGANERVEVDTPNLAVTLSRPGDYRVEVDPQNDATTVSVQSGQADVDGDGASYRVTARQGFRFYGTDLSDFESANNLPPDALDQWAQARERRIDSSLSARYVAPNVVGYEDLDANGTWRVDASYGNVWIPSRVPVGWTPYRDGQWAWIDPWGWTWVDAAPWGYTVSHYGRWAHFGSSWGWVPGPVRQPAVYAPALVVFVGSGNFRTPPPRGGGIGNVGWFPLAPREVYRPTYQASRGYFDRVNRSNAVIAPTTITTTYNTYITNKTVNKVTYVNQQVRGAVVDPKTQPARQEPPEARRRPPQQDNHPVVARTEPPPRTRNDAPGQPPTKVRVVTAPTTATPQAVPPVPQAPPARGNARNEPRGEQRNDQRNGNEPRNEPRADARNEPGRGDRTRDERGRDDRKPGAAPAAQAPAAPAPAQAAAPNAAPNGAPARVEPPKPTAPAQTTAPAPAKPEPAKGEPPKSDAAGNAAQAEANRRNAAARDEAAKADANKAEANRVNAERANADRAKADAARADAAKAEAAKAETNRAKADRANADRMNAEKANAERANAERANAERQNAERAKADAAARAEANKANAAKTESARPATPRADNPNRADNPERAREPRNGRPLTPEEELLRQQQGDRKR